MQNHITQRYKIYTRWCINSPIIFNQPYLSNGQAVVRLSVHCPSWTYCG